MSAPARSHGAEDFAIVVGISATDESAGAVKKGARAFLEWLTARDGGAVPGEHVSAMVADDAVEWPRMPSLRDWFDGLELPRVRRDGPHAGRAGRRFYAYFTGPAVETPPRDYVMMAPGSDDRTTVPSIWIRGFVTSICDSGLFEEVVAFAELTVESLEVQRRGTLEEIGPRKLDRSTMAPSKMLLGFSVRRGFEPTQAGASFTARVLEGLRGAARNTDGDVTARSLIRFVTQPDNLTDAIPTERPWFEVRDPDELTLVEAAALHKPSPNVWLLSPGDSNRAREVPMHLETEFGRDTAPPAVQLEAPLGVGDIVFLQRTNRSAVVAMARVRKAVQSRLSPQGVVARRNTFRLTNETLFQHEVSRHEPGDLVGRLLTDAASASTRVQPSDVLALAGAVIAHNPHLLAELEEWLGERQLAASAYAVALSEARPVDVTQLPASLVRRITRDEFTSILSRARTVNEPERRRRLLRRFATSVRQSVPGRATVLTTLRDDGDPEVQALATPPTPRRETAVFTYACFFDSGALNDTRIAGTVGSLATRVADGLRVVRGEPMWFFAPGPDESDWLQRALKALPESACVVLPYTERLTHDHSWLSFVTRIVELEDARARSARDVGLTAIPSLIIPVLIDSRAGPGASLMNRPAIDGSALLQSPTDDTWATVVEPIVEQIVLRCRALDELAALEVSRPRSTISREQAIGRIELVRGDILELDADAIVNPVGTDPMTSGQIGQQLYARLGRDVYRSDEFSRELGAGETIVTPTYGRIKPRFVIHTCTDVSGVAKTIASVIAGAVGAIDAADHIPDVRTLAIPSLGTGAARGNAAEIAPALLPEVVSRLTRGSHIDRVLFVIQNEDAYLAYQSELARLAGEGVAPVTTGRTLFLTARPSLPGSFLVGANVPVTVSLSPRDVPDATRLVCPLSALELTIYIEAPGFHIEGPNAITVSVIDGTPDRTSVTVSLIAVAEGAHEVTFSVHARGGGARPGAVSATAEMSTVVTVDPAVVLPNIPELIDRRTVPSPQPDVMLYIALERTSTEERLRAHVTCHALGLDRRRLEEPIRLTRADVRAIRYAASRAASGADGAAPQDVSRAMHAFGGTLFDLLAPEGHELRQLIWQVVGMGAHDNRMSCLVISDDDAILPWDLICPHGYDAEGRHHYGECLAHRFAFSYWIGRKGFTLVEEAPIGPLGLVHYGQHSEQLQAFQTAFGGESVVGIADPQLSLEIMRPESDFFGVHLLRYSDASEPGRITAADGDGSAWRPGTAGHLVRDKRLDFTLRRPIVALSLVDDTLETVCEPGERDTQLEQAWSLPLMMARVSAVVGPRWTTAPAADRAFYRAFYDGVRNGVTLGEAVFEARALVRRKFPERADWLAYSYFGHPHCAPYEVQPADGFTLFEPLGMRDDEPFVVGRTYRFRASYRSELPAWFGGRRRARRVPLAGEGVSVMVAPLLGGAPTKLDLVPVLSGLGAGEDYHRVVELTMPSEPTELPVLVQFTRNARELQSTIVRLAVRKGSEP